MLKVANVDLPILVKKRLKEEADFSETFSDFTGESLVGFRQPAAIAVAIIAPVLFAFVYYLTDFFTLMHVAVTFTMSATMLLLGGWYVNRHNIRNAYVRHVRARKNAKADLNVGRAEAATLKMRVQPVFYEHEHGVICIADAGSNQEGKTIYFDVDSLDNDPRWFLYINGDMHREDWSWIRLAGSKNVTEFRASGNRLAKIGDTPYVEAPDAWEAISVALREPQDGDILSIPFEEVEKTIARLL